MTTTKKDYEEPVTNNLYPQIVWPKNKKELGEMLSQAATRGYSAGHADGLRRGRDESKSEVAEQARKHQMVGSLSAAIEANANALDAMAKILQPQIF